MRTLFSLFFAAGVAAYTYTKMGRRTGFANAQSLWTIVGVVFVIVAIIFWTILWTLGIK